ncbi:hypothetical protein [Devosia psychrophila]|jgi:hypothetical protein|uniref:PepSY domain-containing protein n=1 Tax=Devosia psychrophila TaxID=728005 RepID=A0A0F5Q0W5_9HYPH|nr:hypothetical protein [Devosia psychrophila]KKC33714.1 hypothetical protein WH91_07045 [Devosia psychrophila]SFC43501.1 hypothetical protein SAMN04488059_10568 [Devosia psychrophila]
MKTLILKILAPAALAVGIGLAGSGAAQAQSCIDSSAEIQALISDGRIMSQYDAVAAAGYSADQILNFRLCDDGGRYVWIVGILSADGTAQNLTISAE